MLFTPSTLLTLLPALALSAPYSPRSLLPSSCPGTNYPLESEFLTAYQDFCTRYIPRPTLLDQSTPLAATYHLRNADTSTSQWVFKVAASGTSPVIESLEISAQLCLEQFGRFLDTDAAGGLGGAYCVVDGTGGDKVGVEGMSGEGLVCMLDARVEVGGLGASRYGVLGFTGYRRRGT